LRDGTEEAAVSKGFGHVLALSGDPVIFQPAKAQADRLLALGDPMVRQSVRVGVASGVVSLPPVTEDTGYGGEEYEEIQIIRETRMQIPRTLGFRLYHIAPAFVVHYFKKRVLQYISVHCGVEEYDAGGTSSKNMTRTNEYVPNPLIPWSDRNTMLELFLASFRNRGE